MNKNKVSSFLFLCHVMYDEIANDEQMLLMTMMTMMMKIMIKIFLSSIVINVIMKVHNSSIRNIKAIPLQKASRYLRN